MATRQGKSNSARGKSKTMKSKDKGNMMEKFLVAGGEKLLHGLDTRWYDEKFADLKIVCGQQQWKVHKVIVCAQCDFFENACKEIYEEGQTSVIRLDDDSAEMVEIMLRFFYLYDYPSPDGSQALVFHVMVYAIADKYGVDGLMNTALDKFSGTAEHHMTTYDFHSAIRLAWTTTPPQNKRLRINILEWLIWDDCTAFKSVKEMKGFRELMADVSDFSFDLAVMLAQSQGN